MFNLNAVKYHHFQYPNGQINTESNKLTEKKKTLKQESSKFQNKRFYLNLEVYSVLSSHKIK